MSIGSESSNDGRGVAEVLQRTHSAGERQVDRRQEITTTIYSAARARGWDVLEIHWDTYPMSFHWAELKQGERRFALVVHESSPFVALTTAIPDYFNLTFTDDAEFSTALRQLDSPLVPLSAAELAQPLTDDDRSFVRALSDQHERDLKYWKPETVGDVIFNWWD